MRCCRGFVLVFLLVARFAQGEASGRGTPPVDEIVGTWRGSSLCVDREAAPACKDEQVVYEIGASAGKPNTVTVKADKVVDGKREFMSALVFTHEAKSGSWTSEFENSRVHTLWRLTVTGETLRGTMVVLPSRAVVRRMDLKKEK
jgi:hypothetical protein